MLQTPLTHGELGIFGNLNMTYDPQVFSALCKALYASILYETGLDTVRLRLPMKHGVQISDVGHARTP